MGNNYVIPNSSANMHYSQWRGWNIVTSQGAPIHYGPEPRVPQVQQAGDDSYHMMSFGDIQSLAAEADKIQQANPLSEEETAFLQDFQQAYPEAPCFVSKAAAEQWLVMTGKMPVQPISMSPGEWADQNTVSSGASAQVAEQPTAVPTPIVPVVMDPAAWGSQDAITETVSSGSSMTANVVAEQPTAVPTPIVPVVMDPAAWGAQNTITETVSSENSMTTTVVEAQPAETATPEVIVEPQSEEALSETEVEQPVVTETPEATATADSKVVITNTVSSEIPVTATPALEPTAFPTLATPVTMDPEEWTNQQTSVVSDTISNTVSIDQSVAGSNPFVTPAVAAPVPQSPGMLSPAQLPPPVIPGL